MNIKVNELSSIDKKMNLRFEKKNEQDPKAVETKTPEAGMNALMFQGMKNIVTNPNLALNVIANDNDNTEKEEQGEDNNVIPYQANVNFRGLGVKSRKAVTALMMMLATGGLGSLITSCEEDVEVIEVPNKGPDINIQVNVDLSAITSIFEYMQVMWQQMLEQQKITNEQLQQNNQFMKQLIDMYNQHMIGDKEFQEKMYNFMMSSTANQEVIIGLLVQNGMKQDDANKLLSEILQDVQAGNISAAEGMQKILNMLGDIKSLLSKAIADFNTFYSKMLAKQDELIKSNKQGFEELLIQGEITNETLLNMEAQNDSLIVLNNQQLAKANEIKDAIEKSNLDNNANFDKVVETLNVNKKDLIGVMVQLGLTQEEVIKMSKSEIVAAINDNTIMTQKGNEYLAKITKYVSLLPALYNQGNVTQKEIKEFYNLFNEVAMSQGNFNKELLDKMANLIEKMENVEGILDEINTKLTQMMTDFQDFAKKSLQNQQDLMAIDKQGFEEVLNQGKITTSTLVKMAEQNDLLLQMTEKQIGVQGKILDAIVKSNIDNNANFDKVVETLNVNKKDLIGVMVQLGLSQEEVIKMSKSEIIAAINDNTIMTQQGTNLLVKISEQIADLPNKIAGGSITQEQLEQFYILFKDLGNNQGQFNKDMIEKMEVLLDKLTNIQGTLDEISQKLSTMIDEFQTFRKDYNENQATEFILLGQIIDDNNFQTSVLLDMEKNQKSMMVNLIGIEENTNKLLEIVKDDTKHKELIDAIKNIQPGDVAGIDYDKLQEMFNAMGIKIADAVNMSAKQLEDAIMNFKNNYIANEKTNLEQMNKISAKLDEIKIYNGLNKNEIVKAINNVNSSVNQGNENILTELKQLEDAIEVLQSQVQAIYTTLGSMAAKTDVYFQKWDSKFDNILNSLEGFKTQLAQIIANQRTAELYLNKLTDEVNNLKKEIHNWQGAVGGNVDYDKLEQMWQKHDKENFEKYSKLIKDLGIDGSKLNSIQDLLKSIDVKMNYINDNSKILNQILDKLNSIDLNNPNYNAKLDKIIDLLKNFKCNCKCGGNNEGILGDLDNILK